MRFSFRLLPEASKSATVVSVMMVLGLAAIIYGAIMALIQPDFRRLLAFSSISHLGFVVIGLFALELSGTAGQPAHDDQSGIQHRRTVFHRGLFLRAGSRPRELTAFGGMAKQAPLLATFFLLIGLASIGLPGTNGFVGEFLILLGAFKAHWVYGAIAVTGRHFRCGVFSLVLRTRHAGTGGQGRPGNRSGICIPAKSSSRSPDRS